MAIGKPAWTAQKWREKFATELKPAKKIWIYVELRNRAIYDYSLASLIEEFKAEVESLFASDIVLREQFWKAEFGQTLWLEEYYIDAERDHVDANARYFRRTGGLPNSTSIDLSYADNVVCSRPCGGCRTLRVTPQPYFPLMMPHRDADGNFDFLAVCRNIARRSGMEITEVRDNLLKRKTLENVPSLYKIYLAQDYFKIGSCVTPVIVHEWHRKEENWLNPG